ncbi:NLP effector protein 10 [Penicillium oxalicum]|uniref:NLP effector protein 10 n=1 Tax=Penicillium oxalicum TaxID=69781 RepID=UPI0020B90225|nr:NLP effector protein 10 [Penicillium oxalicum]KAI2786970.1 NLP effector protein 10 [Penicillium oxalicum]
MIFSRLFYPLALVFCAAASPTPELVSRGTVGNDKIDGFPQTVPSGTTGKVYLAYQPALYVENGCVPFPAVDSKGNTNGGLKPTGASNGQCSSSKGQIYVRSARSGKHFAVMYSWYMPKDEPSSGLGHRHDWEGVIVWLSESSGTSARNILAVCPSAHGGWDCSKDGFTLSGTTPLIKYSSTWPLDHQCGLTSKEGGKQPLIAWESLPAAARKALDSTDFGKANVPFNDEHFTSNLAAATF